jgi:hypothetical protein
MKNSGYSFNGLIDYIQVLLNDGRLSTSETLFCNKILRDANKFQRTEAGIGASTFKASIYSLSKKIDVAELKHIIGYAQKLSGLKYEESDEMKLEIALAELNCEEIGEKKYDISNASKYIP